jgi:hypothetical protein
MHADFEFVDDSSGGRFVHVGGPVASLRQLLAKGDVAAAARLYDDTQGVAREGLLAEAKAASLDTKRQCAMLFTQARDFAAAAQCWQLAGEHAQAATCFEQAKDDRAAVGAWQQAGESLKAAGVAERLGDWEEAIRLYRHGQSPERLAACQVRAKRFSDAAKTYRSMGHLHGEVEALKAGVVAAPADLSFVTQLGELWLRTGHDAQALQLLASTAQRVAAARDDVPLLTRLVVALERTGNAGADKVRARLAQLPKVATPLDLSALAAVAQPATEAYSFLKGLPLFADLPLDDMQALYRLCQPLRMAAGQHLVEAGAPSRGVFIVVEGQLDVFASNEPTATKLNTLGPGAQVGEISLLQGQPTSARVSAVTPVAALFIAREAFHQFVSASPTAAALVYRRLALSLAERVRALSIR